MCGTPGCVQTTVENVDSKQVVVRTCVPVDAHMAVFDQIHQICNALPRLRSFTYPEDPAWGCSMSMRCGSDMDRKHSSSTSHAAPAPSPMSHIEPSRSASRSASRLDSRAVHDKDEKLPAVATSTVPELQLESDSSEPLLGAATAAAASVQPNTMERKALPVHASDLASSHYQQLYRNEEVDPNGGWFPYKHQIEASLVFQSVQFGVSPSLPSRHSTYLLSAVAISHDMRPQNTTS